MLFTFYLLISYLASDYIRIYRLKNGIGIRRIDPEEFVVYKKLVYTDTILLIVSIILSFLLTERAMIYVMMLNFFFVMYIMYYLWRKSYYEQSPKSVNLKA